MSNNPVRPVGIASVQELALVANELSILTLGTEPASLLTARDHDLQSSNPVESGYDACISWETS